MKALISVSDKSNIIPFARKLIKLGYEIISTGGTLKVLNENNLKVIAVEDVTQFPEMLDGRLKTLHPKIHGGILALRDKKDHQSACKEHGIDFIDLVVVNLYPFEQTISDPKTTIQKAIENIDIGGPTMIRAAAKNHNFVGVIVNPERYDAVIDDLTTNNGILSSTMKAKLAGEAFTHCSRYDAIISNYFSEKVISNTDEEFPLTVSPIFTKISDLRYGENPHQKAAFYKSSNNFGVPSMTQHHGKELSFNNIVDVESAWQIVKEFEIPGAVIIKHTNPCGAAIDNSLLLAYKKAYESDPTSAFGSVVGLNRVVDIDAAKEISKTFVEIVIAPGFDQNALDILTKKPSIRLLSLPNFTDDSSSFEYKYINGGFLLQTPDSQKVTKKEITVVTKKKPTEHEINDLLFAFSVVKHVKSNAILIVKDGKTIGVGAGQMNRVQATDIAVKDLNGSSKGAVMASDAFFPFKDSVQSAYNAGVRAVIQPGGSKRDQESIDFCNAHDMSMVFTGIRHFKH